MKILNIIQDNGSISYYSTEEKYPTTYQKITMKTWIDDSNESAFKEYPVSKIHIDRRKL